MPLEQSSYEKENCFDKYSDFINYVFLQIPAYLRYNFMDELCNVVVCVRKDKNMVEEVKK